MLILNLWHILTLIELIKILRFWSIINYIICIINDFIIWCSCWQTKIFKLSTETEYIIFFKIVYKFVCLHKLLKDVEFISSHFNNLNVDDCLILILDNELIYIIYIDNKSIIKLFFSKVILYWFKYIKIWFYLL